MAKAKTSKKPAAKKAAAKTDTYEGYCVKCKEKRAFEGSVDESGARRMAKGACPECGTTICRILGKAS